MLDAESGAFRYLSGYPEAGEESYQIQAHDVIAPVMQRIAVLHDVEIHAAEVGPGIVPALAWRVQLDRKVIVFSGDTNADNGNLEKLAQGAIVTLVNVQMFQNPELFPSIPYCVLVIRFPVQARLIWLIWWSTRPQ